MTVPLDVLIGCEESGTTRDAFLARGHCAWSCDLLPSRKEGLLKDSGLLDQGMAAYDREMEKV